ncbi:MAG: hypothetical protein KBG28_18325 [Kofleriaceae bacterium]|nr:hypothetical protein [Kofleriaceae bacterium]MBP6835952.1 hypothetical protein [Kofleriaceae bacterium]MBP9205938.1 hypothetical protein [Kofleriaceae bacterium]
MEHGRPSALAIAVALGLVASGAGAGCGGGATEVGPVSPAIEVPSRALTAGDRALTVLPAGPDLLLELDLDRIRANPTLGPALAGWLGRDPGQLPLGAEAPPLAEVRWLVIAAYDVGTPTARTLTIAGAAQAPARTVRLGDDLYALGPPSLVAAAQAAARRTRPAVADEPALLALRARAMPAAAAGAALRACARLSPLAQVALTRELGLDPAPAALSAWADLADDAAAVVWIDGTDPGQRDDARAGAELRVAAQAALAEVAALASVQALGLRAAVRAARLDQDAAWVRVVLVVPPGRLRRLARRLSTPAPVAPAPARPSAPGPGG